jgi:hypothetical protein
MTQVHPYQWMTEHSQARRTLCVVLDSESARDTRQALLQTSRFDQYLGVYGETKVADLADAGPFIFTINQPADKRIDDLLRNPERNWGWLASIAEGELPKLVEHWHARLIVGRRPHQALYRFHDNRVLTRALAHIPVDAYPAYLGPAISVCYWQGEHWQQTDNPAPGTYPVPESAPWLYTPVSAQQAMTIRLANAHRYLLAEHTQAYAKLAEQQEPDTWLRSQLSLADAWGWLTSEQLEFLLVQRLRAPANGLEPYWQARANESPTDHFERVQQLVAFWQGDGPF